MKFSEMNKKQLKEARDELQRRMYPVLRTTRVQGLTDYSVSLEGGTFPATFYKGSGLQIWGRSSRDSGGSMSIVELIEAEAVARKFFEEYPKEGETE